MVCDQYRIICPDTIGRGLSQWSPDPESGYCLDFYARLLTALVDALGVDRMAWVGTSMGGGRDRVISVVAQFVNA